MQTQTWTAAPYGSRWGVWKPDGSLRCIVDSQDFAELIAEDCEKDEFIVNRDLNRARRKYPVKNQYKRPGRQIQEVTTGKIYESATVAAKELNINRSVIADSANEGRPARNGMLFRFIGQPFKARKIFDATAGIVYDSIKYAVDALGCSQSLIYECLKSGKDCRGHRLEWVNES